MASESSIQAAVRLAASKLGYVLWRNNRGAYKDAKGRLVRYGVGSDGAGDLIGYAPITITQEMVGQTVAVFCSIEVKRPDHKTSREHWQNQKEFMERVQARGGIAAIVTSADALQSPPQAFAASQPADSNQGN